MVVVSPLTDLRTLFVLVILLLLVCSMVTTQLPMLPLVSHGGTYISTYSYPTPSTSPPAPHPHTVYETPQSPISIFPRVGVCLKNPRMWREDLSVSQHRLWPITTLWALTFGIAAIERITRCQLGRHRRRHAAQPKNHPRVSGMTDWHPTERTLSPTAARSVLNSADRSPDGQKNPQQGRVYGWCAQQQARIKQSSGSLSGPPGPPDKPEGFAPISAAPHISV